MLDAIVYAALLLALGTDGAKKQTPDVRASSRPLSELPAGALTVLGLEVGRDTLAAARARLGTAGLRDPENQSAAWTVCYKRVDGNTQALTLEFDQRDEQAVLSGFRIEDLAARPRGNERNCLAVPLPTLVVAPGLHLGTTASHAMQRLGTPTAQTPTELEYRYCGSRRMTTAEIDELQKLFKTREPLGRPFWDIVVGIHLTLHQGRVVGIWVFRSETY